MYFNDVNFVLDLLEKPIKTFISLVEYKSFQILQRSSTDAALSRKVDVPNVELVLP